MPPTGEFVHGGYRIVFNRVPEPQFNHGLGFGWAFQLFGPKDRVPTYAVVLKSLLGRRTQESIEKALEIGIRQVKELVDKDGFDSSYICFRWEPDPPEPMEATRVECSKISPGGTRSPYPTNG